MMDVYDPLDFNLTSFMTYVFVLGIILINLYELIKVFTKKEMDAEEILADGQVIKKLVDKRTKKIFVVSCIFVSFSFWPYTVFYWLDFEPVTIAINDYALLHILYNAIFMGMTGNTIYNTGKKVTAFVPSIIGRIRPRPPNTQY